MGITNQSTNSSTLSATVEPAWGVIKCFQAIIQVCRRKTDIIFYTEDIKHDLSNFEHMIYFLNVHYDKNFVILVLIASELNWGE